MAKIKVGFDISQLAHAGGVNTYTRSLTEELSKLSSLDMVYFYSSLRQPYHGNLKNVRKFKLPPTLFEVLFNKLHNVSIEKFLGPLNIFHSSDWVQPPSRAKKVTTYHDVVPLKFPQWSHPKIVSVHRERLKLVEREIDQVIAVSRSTKEDLLKISKIPENKITVVYEAAGKQFKPQLEEKIREFKKKYQLPETFVLSIGGIGERRNLERVKAACKNYHLVIAGQSLPWLDYETELPLLYSTATLLLYPSLYEGFGLPILEAEACGTPVITSNISSMPEVAGKSALLVDPLNQEEITKKVTEAMEDAKLREDLIKLGLENVKRFSWEKAAQETTEVYRRLTK
ncbi:MAG: glycosyltransferase family 4 protein [Candidatus Daviesbacteria bacterium]|nr:MAG: glycosyltransferase family 4 protein [Candidatus Daviesbacteria bacterium]